MCNVCCCAQSMITAKQQQQQRREKKNLHEPLCCLCISVACVCALTHIASLDRSPLCVENWWRRRWMQKPRAKSKKQQQQQTERIQKLQSLVFTITGWWTNNWLARVTLGICIRDCLITCSFITLLFIAMRSSFGHSAISGGFPIYIRKSEPKVLLTFYQYQSTYALSSKWCIIPKMLFSGIYIHTIHVPKTIPWTYEHTTYHPIYQRTYIV